MYPVAAVPLLIAQVCVTYRTGWNPLSIAPIAKRIVSGRRHNRGVVDVNARAITRNNYIGLVVAVSVQVGCVDVICVVDVSIVTAGITIEVIDLAIVAVAIVLVAFMVMVVRLPLILVIGMMLIFVVVLPALGMFSTVAILLVLVSPAFFALLAAFIAFLAALSLGFVMRAATMSLGLACQGIGNVANNKYGT